MEIFNCAQGTEDWFKARLGVATASNFSKVVTSTGDKSKQSNGYAFQLASELVTTSQEETYKSTAMQHGSDFEQEARRAYQERELIFVKEIGFIKCGFYGYSPDGLVLDDGLIEIKCPNQNTHMKYLFDNKLPTNYKAQVQGGLLVSGRKWCDFISYHPNFHEDKRLFIVRVERDEDFIKKLANELKKLNVLKNKILKEI